MSQPTIDVAVALPGRQLLGEGPRWDAANSRLLWVDLDGCAVHALRGAEHRSWSLTEEVGCLAPVDAESVLVALPSQIAILNLVTSAISPICEIDHPLTDMRCNDGACDPAGRFWVGTMHRPQPRQPGSLYCLVDGRLEIRVADVALSNGIGWSPDATVMYFVDSPTGCLDAFDFDVASGSLGRRWTVASIDPAEGAPDGLTVDHEGCVWLALWGGAQVRRYTPSGTLDRVLRLPTDNPTACCFGEDRGDRLFITTASNGIDQARLADQPLAGALFVADVGVTGPPATPFASEGLVRAGRAD